VATDACRISGPPVMRVAIHQPNHIPWLGYFSKMAQCDIFVLLDDAQFSKNNIINRVRILGPQEPRWLTLPVSAKLGDPISKVSVSQPDWRRSHLSLLRNTYGSTPHFRSVWAELEQWFEAAPDGDLAAVNSHFITSIAGKLAITPSVRRASELVVEGRADDRLIAIVTALAPAGTYVSGHGASSYQDPAKFAAAGLTLDYYRFSHPAYEQGAGAFQQGLSVLDALFHLGWEATACAVQPA
jgi:hypothetical protein